ncbi:MAG: HXXEE domain-containing protein [Bacteroidetes bacterium]|nr:HXXEE domain-containing protein [Bacteroidota bacterium]
MAINGILFVFVYIMPTDMSGFAFFLLPVSILHVTEEHLWPGGFLNWLKGFMPEMSPYINRQWSLFINAAYILLCIAAMFNEHIAYITCFVMLINGILHIAGTIHTKKYCPGLITAALLYLPFSITVLYNYPAGFVWMLVYISVAALLHSTTVISLLVAKGRQY